MIEAIQPLNNPAGNWLNLFLDIKFTDRGRIHAWDYYALATDKFFAAVWRPLDAANYYKLIGKNVIYTQADTSEVCNNFKIA